MDSAAEILNFVVIIFSWCFCDLLVQFEELSLSAKSVDKGGTVDIEYNPEIANRIIVCVCVGGGSPLQSTIVIHT